MYRAAWPPSTSPWPRSPHRQTLCRRPVLPRGLRLPTPPIGPLGISSCALYLLALSGTQVTSAAYSCVRVVYVRHGTKHFRAPKAPNFREFLFRDCPKRGTNNALSANLDVLGGKNGSKSAVLVLCKATGQAPLTLFGQSRKGNSRNSISTIVHSSTYIGPGACSFAHPVLGT